MKAAKKKDIKLVKPIKRTIIHDLPNGFYKIMDGIAIPAKYKISYIDNRYSFLKDMKKSETCCAQFTDEKIYRSVLNCAHNYGAKVNKTFTGRPIPKENGGGFGIWRIK